MSVYLPVLSATPTAFKSVMWRTLRYFWLLLTFLTGSGENELAMVYTIIALFIAFSTGHSTFN
jgi:hypothetical protein